MLGKIEQTFAKVKRFFTRGTILVRLFGLSKTVGSQDQQGLIIIQIDGLAKKHMERALEQDKLPFIKDLQQKQHYRLRSFYSGLPSSTPAVQAELFYGVKNAVPAFAFFDSEKCRVFRMIEPEDARHIEEKLEKQGKGLLEGGSSYSNIYTGGAEEAHFCASNMGWGTLFDRGSPFRIIIFFLLHIPSVIKTFLLMVIEFILAFVDMFRGVINGRDLWKELKFVPARVGITILARELVIAGISMDVARNRKIIHCNFLGYDEQAHRRGPSSAFAYWGLKGIDNAVRRICNIAGKSRQRHYDIWIYSDHGQEDSLSYQDIHGRTVQETVAGIFGKKRNVRSVMLQEKRGVQSQRIRHLGWSRIEGVVKRNIEKCLPEDMEKPVVTAMGPVGFVYCRPMDRGSKEHVAKRLIKEAHIPSVMIKDEKEGVIVWNSSGKWHLPEDASHILGNDHLFLEEVTKDLIELVYHPDAGEFVISGWDLGKQPLSFPSESGAHAGPGTAETEGFILLPSRVSLPDEDREWIRPLDLRKMAMNFLNKKDRPSYAFNIRKCTEIHENIRIMTYNVHSCIGMDGRISTERIARVIAQYEPDVIALQELDSGLERTGRKDQPMDIARSLAMGHHFHPPISLEDEEYGDAILSRLPISLIKSGNLAAWEKHTGEVRGALWVKIDVENGSINVINTHLGFRKHARSLQLMSLLGKEWLEDPKCRGPVVLCGDFNFLPSSRDYRRVCRKLRDVQVALPGKRPQKTFYSRYPVGRIDYIFCSSDFEVLDFKTCRSRLAKTASDHVPLIADLSLKLNCQ